MRYKNEILDKVPMAFSGEKVSVNHFACRGMCLIASDRQVLGPHMFHPEKKKRLHPRTNSPLLIVTKYSG
jgi:hypothetical protein